MFRRITREALDSSRVKLLRIENGADIVTASVFASVLLVLELDDDEDDDDTLESAEESMFRRASRLAISYTEEDESAEPFPPNVTRRLWSSMVLDFPAKSPAARIRGKKVTGFAVGKELGLFGGGGKWAVKMEWVQHKRVRFGFVLGSVWVWVNSLFKEN